LDASSQPAAFFVALYAGLPYLETCSLLFISALRLDFLDPVISLIRISDATGSSQPDNDG
jgi:hypothetical protein